MVTAPASPPLHLRGVVLPDEHVRDLWVVDGVVTAEPVAGATTITPAGTASEPSAWIIPGLVDLHCHVGLALHGAVPDEEAERQALADRDAGVLLLRDAGSPADTRWMDERVDLPRVVRAGRHIARTRRYMRNYGHEIEPEQLSEYVAVEAQRGDGWVKLVGDWIDRDTGDLGPCWPRWALDEAMATAHEHGARVTAHVFGEEALADLVDAGIDCIEHATGLRDVDDGRLVDDMARRGVAIVPTLINIDNFGEFAAAGEAKFPGYAEHMRRLEAGSRRNVAEAFEAGVPVYAGTDAGGQLAHGLLGHEVVRLAEAGLPGESAVAAGSWEARRFLLGDPPGGDFFAAGTSADLVVLADDPRRSPGTLLDPLVVLLRGRVVG
ncbi:MAG: amidohydrolase family protein [Jiangellales bacterium]